MRKRGNRAHQRLCVSRMLSVITVYKAHVSAGRDSMSRRLVCRLSDTKFTRVDVDTVGSSILSLVQWLYCYSRRLCDGRGCLPSRGFVSTTMPVVMIILTIFDQTAHTKIPGILAP